MLRQLNVVVILFFGNKFLEYSIQGVSGGDQFLKAKIVTMSAITDCITYSLLLYVFRPRKEWPDYFLYQLGD